MSNGLNHLLVQDKKVFEIERVKTGENGRKEIN